MTFPAPHGAGGKGNSGVTALMESTPGSIAYIAVSYLFARDLPAAAMQNARRQLGEAEPDEIENAARRCIACRRTTRSRSSTRPRARAIAYPISTFTYAIVHRNVTSAVKSFIKFAISSPGQQFAPGLDFAALPKVVVNAARNAVNGLH